MTARDPHFPFQRLAMSRPAIVAVVTTVSLGAAALLLWGLSPQPLDRSATARSLSATQSQPVSFAADPLAVQVEPGRWTQARVTVGDAGRSEASHFVVSESSVIATPRWFSQAAGDVAGSLDVHVYLSGPAARPTAKQQSDVQRLLGTILPKCGLSAGDVTVVGVE